MKAEFDYIWTDKKRTIFGLPISFTRYFLTDTKFITRKGFFTIEEDEFDLYKVSDKKLVLPFGQRIFGCGTVYINVKDTDTPLKEVKSIKMPREFMKKLDVQVDMLRDKYGVRGRDMIAGCHTHDYDDADDSDYDMGDGSDA